MEKNSKENYKKGFTLIELLAVIVILGILMTIAIPAVTRYIERSKKEAFIASLNSAIDSVKYDVVSGGNNYSFEQGDTKYYYLSDIETEKGKLGKFIEGKSYISVYKNPNTNEYQYRVQAIDEDDNCVEKYLEGNLNISDIKKHSSSPPFVCNFDGVYPEYERGSTIKFAGIDWYVSEYDQSNIEDLTLIKKEPLTNAELGTYASNSNSNTMSWYWDDNCHSAGTYGYSDQITTSCNDHKHYNNSKIKEFLEGEYLNSFGQYKSKIKSITLPKFYDGYQWVGKSYSFWKLSAYNPSDNYSCGNYSRACYPYYIFNVYPVIKVPKTALNKK